MSEKSYSDAVTEQIEANLERNGEDVNEFDWELYFDEESKTHFAVTEDQKFMEKMHSIANGNACSVVVALLSDQGEKVVVEAVPRQSLKDFRAELACALQRQDPLREVLAIRQELHAYFTFYKRRIDSIKMVLDQHFEAGSPRTLGMLETRERKEAKRKELERKRLEKLDLYSRKELERKAKIAEHDAADAQDQKRREYEADRKAGNLPRVVGDLHDRLDRIEGKIGGIITRNVSDQLDRIERKLTKPE